jgi:hypothetical protein
MRFFSLIAYWDIVTPSSALAAGLVKAKVRVAHSIKIKTIIFFILFPPKNIFNGFSLNKWS